MEELQMKTPAWFPMSDKMVYKGYLKSQDCSKWMKQKHCPLIGTKVRFVETNQIVSIEDIIVEIVLSDYRMFSS